MQSEAKTILSIPLNRLHPRLRFIDGAPEGGDVPATQAPAPGATPATDEQAADLGDAGKKALDAMKAERKAARDEAKAEKLRADALQAQIEALNKPAEEVALEKARKDGETAATAAANVRIVKSELKAAAASKLSNPADALAFIDTSKFEVDENGDVDSDALNEAINDLLTARPYLASGHQLPFQGTADGGAKPEPKPEATLEEQILAAQAKGDFKTVIALENRKLDRLKA